MTTRSDIEFASGNVTVRGWLYMPDGDGPFPGVVLAEGFAGVREISVPLFAEPLVQAGFAVLGFDYPYFGASEGEPRQRLDPRSQLRAYRDALTFLGALPEVTSLGACGASFAGAHVIALCAEHAPISAAVSIAPFTGVAPLELLTRPLRTLRVDGPRGLTRPLTVVSPDPGSSALMANAQAYEVLMAAREDRAPAFENWITVDSGPRIAAYRPLRGAARITTPIRLIALSEDIVTPPEPVAKLARKIGDAADFHVLDGQHFDLLGSKLDELTAMTVDWMSAHLQVDRPVASS